MIGTTRWWHRATGYQIYPRSFADSDGDGIGDIPGIIDRLDHLADLGIGFIWLSPVYRSPMIDNGYDISDYRDIAPDFGTLDDMDRLIAEAGARGIRIVMDLVVNHTSDRHAWFEAARAARDCPEHAYYVWRDPAPGGGPPSELRACFGGSAWTWVPEVGRYYLGYFSPAQPDLDWTNPALRAEIHDMMRWWLDRGIAGFRMDVISLIGKDVDSGLFEEGPHLHAHLKEMHARVLRGRDVVTIGESWSVSPDTAPLYCGRARGELDMVFQFNHVVQGWDELHGKWRPRPFDLVRMKRVLFDWQDALAEDGWNSLFLSNHDLPRHVSVYGDDGAHRVASAKAWATALHLMKGTPFVYQGEEIGMTNRAFTSIDEFRDLETLNHHADQIARGMSTSDFLAAANRTSRDHARTPMQWTAEVGAGFTTGTPWLGVNPNRARINVAADRADPDGVFAHYQRLIAMRHQHPVIVQGRLVAFAEDHPQVLAYCREGSGACIVVIANLGGDPAQLELPAHLQRPGKPLLPVRAGLEHLPARLSLAPWEARALLQRVADS